MSWHFLQGQEAASWADTCLDGAPSALLNLLNTQDKCCLPDSATDYCRHSQFGMTFGPLTERLGAGKSMSLAEDSPAKTFPLQETATALTENEADSGWKWPGSLAKYDRVSRSWKTRQLSLLGGCTEFSETWPKWGSMRDGEFFPLPTLDSPICEKESGLWPTPDASCGKRGWSANVAKGLVDGVRKRKSGATIGSSLLWEPRLLPDYAPGFHLNPEWVEWLMGWPEGQTDLLPLATDKFRSWQQQHGVF